MRAAPTAAVAARARYASRGLPSLPPDCAGTQRHAAARGGTQGGAAARRRTARYEPSESRWIELMLPEK
eukprot:1591610-Prymnesium_polylepis.1